jgi:hypothetical protein
MKLINNPNHIIEKDSILLGQGFVDLDLEQDVLSEKQILFRDLHITSSI